VSIKSQFRRFNSDEKIETVINYIDMLDTVHDESINNIDVRIDYSDHNLKLAHAREFTEILMEYLQVKHNYGYILIFDGLDSVTIDYIQYNEYREWIDQIDTATDNDTTKYKAVYLVTMRDYSFITMYINYLKDKRFEKKRYVVLEIEPKPLMDILERKYTLAVNRLKEIGHYHSVDEIKNINHNLMKLVFSELHNITGLEIPAEKEMVDEKYFISFSKLNNDNLRSTMRFFRELIIMAFSVFKANAFKFLIADPKVCNIVENFIGKEWILYRVLLHGGCKHTAYKNRVSYNRQGYALISTSSKAIIPNLFNYRDFVTQNDIWIPKNLVKIRVIQYLLNQDSPSGILDVIKFLKTVFKYDHEDLRFETREMIYNGMLIPNSFLMDVIVAEQNSTDYIIELTELSKVLIKKTDL